MKHLPVGLVPSAATTMPGKRPHSAQFLRSRGTVSPPSDSGARRKHEPASNLAPAPALSSGTTVPKTIVVSCTGAVSRVVRPPPAATAAAMAATTAGAWRSSATAASHASSRARAASYGFSSM